MAQHSVAQKTGLTQTGGTEQVLSLCTVLRETKANHLRPRQVAAPLGPAPPEMGFRREAEPRPAVPSCHRPQALSRQDGAAHSHPWGDTSRERGARGHVDRAARARGSRTETGRCAACGQQAGQGPGGEVSELENGQASDKGTESRSQAAGAKVTRREVGAAGGVRNRCQAEWWISGGLDARHEGPE